MDKPDKRMLKALLRYQIISAFLSVKQKRGAKKALLEKLANQQWHLDSGEVIQVSAETIRSWLRRYKTNGFDGLFDKQQVQRMKKLRSEIIEMACKLKLEVPERSIDKIIIIMEELQMVEPGTVRRSTLHRALQRRGLSARRLMKAKDKDLDRFEADYSNNQWQSDMLTGPWLTDPKKPGKKRRAYLYAFLDDASRLLLYGKFFFKGDLPALELVFKRSIQRYGLCKTVYYDNGAVYRSLHMRLVCAELGIHKPIHTTPFRPEGHGKIEAFNRYCNNNFMAELKASSISTLDELNEAFFAWCDEEYNRKVHSELGMTPHERWLKDADRIQYADEERLRIAFLWREKRTPDKCGIISLFGKQYKVSSFLAKKRVEIRYNPDDNLDQIEVWHGGKFHQRARLRDDRPHRIPPQINLQITSPEPPKLKTDYLGHLVKKRKNRLQKTSCTAVNVAKQQIKGLDSFTGILNRKLDPEIIDLKTIKDFYQSYGPFHPEKIETELDDMLTNCSNNLHINHYLDVFLQILPRIRSPFNE